jgi:hypothetical protein
MGKKMRGSKIVKKGVKAEMRIVLQRSIWRSGEVAV